MICCGEHGPAGWCCRCGRQAGVAYPSSTQQDGGQHLGQPLALKVLQRLVPRRRAAGAVVLVQSGPRRHRALAPAAVLTWCGGGGWMTLAWCCALGTAQAGIGEPHRQGCRALASPTAQQQQQQQQQQQAAAPRQNMLLLLCYTRPVTTTSMHGSPRATATRRVTCHGGLSQQPSPNQRGRVEISERQQ